MMRAVLRGLFWFLSAGWWPAALNAAIYQDCQSWFMEKPRIAGIVHGEGPQPMDNMFVWPPGTEFTIGP